MKIIPRISLILIFVFTSHFGFGDDNPDPRFFYFYDGKLIGARGIQLGDEANWSVGVTNFQGQSEKGAIRISPSSYQAENDALHLSFSGKTKGQFAIYGPNIDLSPFEDLVTLIMEVKIDKISKRPVLIGMDCGYPCRSEGDMRKQLRKLPKGKWTTFAIPLNCISLNKDANNFNLSKINGPLLIGTDGQLEMSIANVGLAKMPEGEKGCRQ